MTDVIEVERAPHGRVVLAKLGRDDELVARARRSLALDHPAIARCIELVEVDDGFALVQERCAGVPIGQAVHGLDDDAVISLVDQVLAAFEHAHELGIAHGDLQPDDIVVDGGKVKVRRFGFARPSRPPAPRYDLIAIGRLLAPLVRDPDVHDVLVSPMLDASTARRNLRRPARPSASDSLVATQPAAGDAAPTLGDRIVNRQLGDFVIREKMREGGLGMVFRATQKSLGREAVIKVPLSRTGPISDSMLKRFLAEARVASSLDHPYAAHIYAFGSEPDGVMWIAMELVDGTPLDDYIRHTGPMPAARAVAFVERLCQVVHRAHELRIVHRDIKPANVMVMQRSGRLLPKLLDFGIARVFEGAEPVPQPEPKPADTADDERLTQAGSAIGSPLYMSPEQWDDASKVGPPSDIYALGVLTYELLAGRPPFKAPSIAAIADAHIHEPVPSLGPGFPPGLDAVIARAMSKDPAQRFATALELGTALMAAAGVAEELAPLPRLPDDVRTEALGGAPPPIAACVAVLDNARNVHQARSALDQTVDAAASWLGVVALLARSRIGPGTGDAAHALELVRELGERLLEPREWLELARDLCAPYFKSPDVHPLAELVVWLRDRTDLLQLLLSRRADNERIVDEATARGALVDDIGALAALLDSLAFFHHLRIVVPHESRTAAAVSPLTITITRPALPRAQAKPADSRACEVWAGTHREIRPLVAFAGITDPADVVYVDADGAPVLKLFPLVQPGAPIPGQPDVMFVFAGTAGGQGRLVAAPHGYALASQAIHEWLRTQILDDHGQRRAGSLGAERSPFRGLSAFTADDADLFFGREKEQATCLNRLLVQPLVAVVGRSGAGKSSFVHAGVIPALPDGWLHVSLRPGASPLGAVRVRAAEFVPQAIGDAELAAALITAASVRRTTLVLAIDQFEEVFTLCSDAGERERFADLITRLAVEASGVRVILTLRDDFLIQAEQLLRGRIGPHLMILTTPSGPDLERILREPVARLGYAFDDPKLVEKMVRDVGDQPGALALLSFAADELWQRRDRHFKRLTTAAYDAMKGVGGALVQHAEQLISSLSASEVALVREVFRRLVTPDGTRAVVARRDILEVVGHRAAIIEKLVDSRLVVASEGLDGEEQLEVAHETLLQTWPRLVQWRSEDAEGARMREQLRVASKQWEARTRPDGLLWRGDALAEYRLWRQRHPEALTAAELAFADASVRHERRAIWRRRIALAAVFLGLVGFSGVALRLRHQAVAAKDETQRRLAASYIAQARTKLQDGRHWEALASVLAAQRLGADGPIVAMLRGLARQPARALEYRIAASQGRTWSARYSPDGKLIVTAGEDGGALWRAGDGELVTRFADTGTLRDAVFDRAGTRVATQGFDGTLRIYEVPSGRQLRVIAAVNGVVRCAAWRDDGGSIVTGGDDGFLKLWDPTTGENRGSFATEHNDRLSTCEFGGELVAGGTDSGQVLLVTPEAGTGETLGHHPDWARSLAFDATHTRLFTASSDKTVRMWDVPSRKLLATFGGAGDWLISISVAPDGKHVAATSRDARAYVWDVESGALQTSLVGHKGTVWSVQYSPDGTRLVTSADDGSASIWDARSGALLATLEGHDVAVITARFSPDGAHVLTASYDGTVVSWRSSSMSLLESARPDAPAICAVSSSADARWVTRACPDAVTVWDMAEAHVAATLPGAEIAVATGDRVFAITPAGVRVWSIPSGQTLASFPVEGRSIAIAAAADRLAIEDDKRVIRVYTASGQLVEQPRPPSPDSLALVPGAAWLAVGRNAQIETDGTTIATPDGSRFAVIGFKDLWISGREGQPRFALVGHHAPTLSASFDRTGRRAVSTSQDGGAIVWDVERRKIICRLVSGSQFFAGAVFDDTGRVVITLDGTGSLQLFDSDTGDPLGRVPGRMRRPSLLRRAGDGTLFGFSLAGEVSRWQLAPDSESLSAAEHDLACKAPIAERVGACPR